MKIEHITNIEEPNNNKEEGAYKKIKQNKNGTLIFSVFFSSDSITKKISFKVPTNR